MLLTMDTPYFYASHFSLMTFFLKAECATQPPQRKTKMSLLDNASCTGLPISSHASTLTDE